MTWKHFEINISSGLSALAQLPAVQLHCVRCNCIGSKIYRISRLKYLAVMHFEVVSDVRYGLKHFVTAKTHQLTHNGFDGFDTDVAPHKRERTPYSPFGVTPKDSLEHPWLSRDRCLNASKPGSSFGVHALTP